MTQDRAQRALPAIEAAYSALRGRGLPLPPSDGQKGGSHRFDLYLADIEADLLATGHDGSDLLSGFDGATTFGIADPAITQHEQAPCFAQLLSEAALLSLDAAESPAVREASARYFAFLVTGELGCRAELHAAQQASHRGLFRSESAVATALFFTMIGERNDGQAGGFLNEIWQFARQRSRDRITLRASPDFVEALSTALTNGGESLDALAVQFAADRYFAGNPNAAIQAGYSAFRTLPAGASVPLQARLQLADLPKHHYGSRNLGAYGSAYLAVDVRQMTPGESLSIWLRGAYDATWALTAVKLDGQGHEVGRLTSPLRPGPKVFLPVLIEAGVSEVVLVVTRLPRRPVDPDGPAVASTGYKLVIDRDTGGAIGLRSPIKLQTR